MLQILIADDHALTRIGLRDLLEAHLGWQVCGEAPDGRRAVDLAEQLKPQVAVVDLVMPYLGGVEATRRIHEVSRQTEVLILAGAWSEQIEEESISAGARGFVLKTEPEQRVVAAVESLSRHQPCFHGEAARADGGRASRLRVRMHARAPTLTPRETEITQLLAEGKPNWCIATILGISTRTVETHRAKVMQKLGLESVVELVHYAVRNQMVEP